MTLKARRDAAAASRRRRTAWAAPNDDNLHRNAVLKKKPRGTSPRCSAMHLRAYLSKNITKIGFVFRRLENTRTGVYRTTGPLMQL